MDDDVDYANIYKSLSSEAKKGFFKKQHRAGSGEDFAFASKTLNSQGCPDLAAVFLLGKARCESSLKNVPAEASSLITAARNFIRAEDELDYINAVSFGENLDCSTQCTLKAVTLYDSSGHSSMTANGSIYLSDIIMRYQRWAEALPHLKRALEYLSDDPSYHLSIVRKMLNCQLYMRDWPGSLTSCIEIQTLLKRDRSKGIMSDDQRQFWCAAEILRTCILLFTVPSSKLSCICDPGGPLDMYAIDRLSPPADMDEEIFLHLQSLVLAYRSGDTIEIERAVTSLQGFLDPDHWHLLSLLTDSCTASC